MAKTVTITMKRGPEETFLNITEIQEDKHYEHVIGLRLYEDGQLRAKFDYAEILHVKVTEQPDD
jgi:hypothetical protein